MKDPKQHSAYDFANELYEEVVKLVHPAVLPDEAKERIIRKALQSFDPYMHVMGTKEASEKWGVSIKRIDALCSEGTIDSKLIGRTRILDRNQEYQRERSPKILKNNREKSETDEN